MKNQELVDAWVTRAESNLYRARAGRLSDRILFEDLCYDCQQAAEKSLKGLLLSLFLEIPRTHNVGILLQLLNNTGIIIPETVILASALTEYAVNTRYPGDYEQVSEEEYEAALHMAEDVYSWVKAELSKRITQ
jgi:HEPN domain-containing protein